MPVLSKTAAFTVWVISRISPLRIKIPFSAPSPVPTITAVGVASPKAQGQAITSTLVNTLSAKEISLPAISHAAAVITAIVITTGTNTPATLSAVFEMGAFLFCASSTNLIIFARAVSLPILVTVTYITPLIFMLPPVTRLPSVFSIGRLSPVSIDSSALLSPFIILPSSGMLSPGFTITVSPTATSFVGTVISLPSRSTRAVSGDKRISFSTADAVLRLLCSSSCLPRATRVITTATDS